jgi:Flp pilus assembly protein TadG
MIKKVSSFLQTVRGKGRRDSKRTRLRPEAFGGRSGRPRSLLRDARGTIAVYVAISTPVLLGIGAISLDLTRIMSVNTDLQSAADAAAMSGADELDRFSGARDRAKATAKDAVANLQTFATGAAEVTISTADCAGVAAGDPCMRFLKSLPADDGDPITNANLAATDKEARFIEVNVGTRTVTNLLIRLVGGPATSSTSATAVAGNDPVYCNVPPMFMCNPTEPPGNTDLELSVFAGPSVEGRQMEMFHQGAGGSLTPGNFGLLCPLGTESQQNCGGSSVRDALASTAGTCISAETVTTKTGVTLEMVRTGVNARSDYWAVQATDDNNVPWRQQDRFQPAANVTQGGEKDGGGGVSARCEYDPLPATQAMGLPRDQCHLDGNCGTVPGNINGYARIGDGNWNYKEYFRINQGCNQSANPTCKPADWDALSGGAGWPPTRYEVYRYELEKAPEAIVMPNQTIYDSGGNPIGTTAENGHSQCFTGTPPPIPGYNYFPGKKRDQTLLADRRIMPVAVANCYALEANGISTNGKFSFQPAELVYVFLTEPMRNPSDSELYVEILGPLDTGAQDVLARDVVQLYRR